MLTAHLPSGYVLARWLRPKAMTAALVGAMLPDIDMLWFLLVDHGAVHHHRYATHIPMVWAIVASVVLALLWATPLRPAMLVFFAAIFLHLALDTIAGGILWGWPFDQTLYSFVTIPAHQSHWVLSFILHWTFLLELAIWALALLLWLKRARA